MSLKEKTREELENRIHELENTIRKKGVGSGYLEKAERIQRDVNIGLILGGATVLVGAAAWALLRSGDES